MKNLFDIPLLGPLLRSPWPWRLCRFGLLLLTLVLAAYGWHQHAIPGVEVKIAEDGEILLRGPAVMDGYYNLPDDQSLDAEGWFHTGDIGEFEGKHLKITDRKKDLIVLGNGKNVAPQPIEIKLKGSRFISEVVVLGDGMDHCVALVIPSEEAVKAELQLSNDPDWIVNSMVSKLIKSEIDAINKTLAPFEMVKKHRLIAKPFTRVALGAKLRQALDAGSHG